MVGKLFSGFLLLVLLITIVKYPMVVNDLFNLIINAAGKSANAVHHIAGSLPNTGNSGGT